MFFQAYFPFLFAQAIGVIALTVTIVAFQRKSRKQILLGQMVGSFLFSVHFFLLGAYTGALTSIVVVARNFVFERFKRNVIWLIIFIGVLFSLVFISWRGWSSLLPVVATTFATYGAWQENPRIIRFLLILACLIWIPYLLIVHSYPGLINQVITTISLVISVVRNDRTWIQKKASYFT